MRVLTAILMLASSEPARMEIPFGGGCPRGGVHLVTIPGVLGACAVAFDGNAILACAPEQVADGVERQAVRAVAVEGNTTAPEVLSLPTGAASAVDIDVGLDGVVAIADAGGGVRLIQRDGAQRDCRLTTSLPFLPGRLPEPAVNCEDDASFMGRLFNRFGDF